MLKLPSAAFDESGTHGNPDGATTIAGFVATADTWDSIETAWNDELAKWKAYGVNTYHAVDCLWGNGEFANRELSQFIRHLIIFNMSNILGAHDVQAVYSQVLNDHWKAATSGEAAFLARYPKPYDFLFDDIAHQLRGWAKRKAGGERIAPIFAIQKEYQDRSRDIFDAYLRRPAWQEALTSITFGHPSEFISLQCADHIAFWVRYERERIENTHITLENGGMVNALANATKVNGLHQGGCWVFDPLRRAVKEFTHHGMLALP